MRRLLVSVALGLAALLLAPAPALGDYGVDCSDFPSSRDAQDYYESQGGLAGGDPDGLDRDQDGYACEWGPGPDPGDTTQNDSPAHSAGSGGGVPWWVWAGGGIAVLWIIGLIRINQE